MATTESAAAERHVKQAHAAMWALGDYPTVAADLVTELGRVLVAACEVSAPDRVLDVAAGPGNAAVIAAGTGARVVASDLTPELLAAGEAAHGRFDGRLTWEQADAECLPYPDATFDAVLSCVGAMFAPHHQQTAGELVRVLRPGGRLGLISWTSTGFIGRMFAVMKPFVALPPAGTTSPLRWGDPDHVRELLGDTVVDLKAERRMLAVSRFSDGAAFRDYFKAGYGPTVAAYRGLADQPERTAALDAALAALGDAEAPAMEWEYLLVTARRRSGSGMSG